MSIFYPDNTASRTVLPASGINDSALLLNVSYSGVERSLTLAELKKTPNLVTVANVAALYALNYAIDNQLYMTLGYTNEGIGANLYRYDAGSSATPDYGFTLDGIGGAGSGTGTGRFIAVDRTIADVACFGALDSQTGDQSTAIQRAVNAIQSASNGGGIVYFSKHTEGIYKISSTITVSGSNIVFRGPNARGSDGGSLYHSMTAPAIEITDRTVTAFHINPPDGNNGVVRFENLMIRCLDRATDSSNYGIHFEGTSFFGKCSLDSVNIWGFSHGVYSSNEFGMFTITNCDISSNAHWGIKADGGAFNQVLIQGSTIRQNGYYDTANTTFGAYRLEVADQTARLALEEYRWLKGGDKVLQVDNNTIYLYNGSGVSVSGNWSATADLSVHGGIFIKSGYVVKVVGCDLEGQSIGLRALQCEGLSIDACYTEVNNNCSFLLEHVNDFSITNCIASPSGDQRCAFVIGKSHRGIIKDNPTGVSMAGTGLFAQYRDALQKVYLSEVCDIDTTYKSVIPINILDASGSRDTWIAHSEDNVNYPIMYPKQYLYTAGQSPFNGTFVDSTEIGGPFGVRQHVKKLTATANNAYALCGYASTFLSGIISDGDWACAHTWYRGNSANNTRPSLVVVESKNGGAYTNPSVLYAMRIPEDRWVLLRYVRKIVPADFASSTNYVMYFRNYVHASGDYIYMYGNSNNVYSSFPYHPQPGNVSPSGTTYPIMRGATGSSAVYGGEEHLGAAAPVDGTWNNSDKVYTVYSIPSGYIGWVCTSAGTPGTWKTFGAISP